MTYKAQVEAMNTFFYTDATKEIKFRKKQLKALKKEIQHREADILTALNQDLGKGKVEGYASEIGIILKSISMFLKEIKTYNKVETVTTPMLQFPAKSFVMREPLGTVLIIGPFNYPFQLVMEPLIGAIAAGNCAVVKPSELTPHTSQVISEIIAAAFPPDYVMTVLGEKEATTALLQEKFDFIFFTGSTRVGQIVYEAASRHLTPVALELGGKSPTIIDETANIKVAAERITFGKFMNAGQTCVAPDYILIDRKVKDKFIEAMRMTIAEFYGKNPAESADFGRIVNDNHFRRLSGILASAEGRIVSGGRTEAAERYIEPTLIDDVTLDDEVMKEEIFGPLLPIITFDSRDEVFDIIRSYDKPLALYIFSEDSDFVKTVFKRLSFGGGCINDTLMHVSNPYLPFGGVGASGIGAYHGKYSYDLFSHQKAYMTKGTKLETGLMFPPYKGKFKYIRQFYK
ncbi:aldehyde dehydrogenase [Macrococcus equipercicus]|uniref:Aldehyde dehydrogenase n=1 Tax=Macrococcus equipercicus TaxID=69967 RepID=A0ABQ6R798_9STAP|nr:aldehyde dehydrogenase [Macrococcus equipercicus]KAA1037726.1 aldehyde dehydrogenase [Macrococcus equipercicus]